MKYLVLVSLMVLSFACNKSDDKKGGDKPKGGNEVETITDVSSCVGTSGAPASITSNSWNTIFQEGDVTISDKVSFTTNSVYLSRTCSRTGMSLNTTVRANALITADTIEVLETQQQDKEIGVGNVVLVCPAAILKGGPSGYSFQGPCLKMTSITGSGETLLLVPSL